MGHAVAAELIELLADVRPDKFDRAVVLVRTLG